MTTTAPQSQLDKIGQLLNKVSDFDIDHMTLVVSAYTLHGIQMECHYNVHADFDKHWPMKIETVRDPRPPHVTICEAESFTYPLCMYLKITKKNGRIIYIDDPETNEAFL